MTGASAVDTAAAAPPPAPGSPPAGGDTGKGTLTIAPRVVEKIAATAVGEVDQAGGTSRRVLGVSVGGDDQARVSADVDGDVASVVVTMAVQWPSPVLEVSRQVRALVRERLTTFVGLRTVDVDIEITALTGRAPREERRVQ